MGITRKQVRTALAGGRVVRVARGVYVGSHALTDDPAEGHLLRALAVQLGSEGLVACAGTAALALGLPLLSTARVAAQPPTFTRAPRAGARSERRPDASIRLAALPSDQVVTLPSGLVVTSPARTAVDLARCSDLPEALMALDAAARMQLWDLVGSPGRHQYRRADKCREAVAALAGAADVLRPAHRSRVQAMLGHVDVRHESPLESFGAGHIAQAGLPPSEPQARVVTAAGTYFVDRLFAEYGVVAEFDGAVKYGDPEAILIEKEREGQLRDEGLTVVRWTGREAFGRPHLIPGRLVQALMRAGWRP